MRYSPAGASAGERHRHHVCEPRALGLLFRALGVVVDVLPGVVVLLLLLVVGLACDAPPDAAPHALLLQQGQDQDDGHVPDADPEKAPGAAAGAALAPETDRLAGHPGVYGQRGDGKGPLGDASGAQADADGEEAEQAVAQGNAGVTGRVSPGEHAQARGAVLVAHAPRQRHKVGELPGEEEGGEEPAAHARAVGRQQELAPRTVADGRLARRGGPAHERRDAADDGADPRVCGGEALHGRVDARVEDDVCRAQERHCRVDAQVQGGDAGEGAAGGEEERGARRHEAADQGARARAAHEGVGARLVEHVEGVCGGGAERRASGQEEQRERREGGQGRLGGAW